MNAAVRGRIIRTSVNSPGCVSTSIDPRMLLDDDVVTDGQAKPSPFSSRFCREEGIEHLLPDLGRNAGAVVPNPDLYAVAEVLRRSRESGLIAITNVLLFALGRRIKAVDSVGNVRVISCGNTSTLTGGRIKEPFHIDLEALLLGASTVIGEIEALLDEGVGIDQPMIARAFARVQQHVLHDHVDALAMLNNLIEYLAECSSAGSFRKTNLFVPPQLCYTAQLFIDQFGRHTGEVVDEIQRVFDLVSNSGQSIGRVTQASVSGQGDPASSANLPAKSQRFGISARFLIAAADWAAKVLIKSIVFCGKVPGVRRRTTSIPTMSSPRSSGAIKSQARKPARRTTSFSSRRN